MEEIKVRQLINPTPEEVNAAAEVWRHAFHKDVFNRSCIGGNYDYMHAFQHAILSAALVGGGEGWVAQNNKGVIVGAAVWFGPGTGLMHTPEQGEAGFNALLGSYSEDLVKWWMEYFLPKYENFTTETLGEGVKLNSWHLQQIGVSPELQGKGIGKALVKAVENKPENSGKLFVLETEAAENVPIYEKLGYTVEAKTDFTGSVPGSDFPMWIMRKQL